MQYNRYSKAHRDIMFNIFFIVCKAFRSNKGIAAIFGPQSGTTSSHIQSICDTLEIPHIETRWDYRLIRDDYSVNLYPHPFALGQVSNIFCSMETHIYRHKSPALCYSPFCIFLDFFILGLRRNTKSI